MEFNKKNIIPIPSNINTAIEILCAAGYKAYIVGGCVRDFLRNTQPHDWDLCTSATPKEMLTAFSGYRVIPTGLKHGTLTILIDNEPVEITTFRVDGNYDDNRRPNSVEFVKDINLDLSRRDFTMNAIAYNPKDGMVDPFGGRKDIQNKIIKCVGNPEQRFKEDALRILRAIRFASVFGYTIDPETDKAIHKYKILLDNISKERIQSELVKILSGSNVLDVLLKYSDIICQVIPELAPCVGFDQNNRFHCFTVYEHIAHVVANCQAAKADTITLLSALLHDIGKPRCYTENETGGHFYGHGDFSKQIANKVLRDLKFDKKTITEVSDLVAIHDAFVEPQKRAVRRFLAKVGDEQCARYLKLRMADIFAHAPNTQQINIDRVNAVREIYEQIREDEACFSIKDLAVNGNDLMSELLLKPSPVIGQILNHLLECVLSEKCQNDKAQLLEEAKNFVEFLEDEK